MTLRSGLAATTAALALLACLAAGPARSFNAPAPVLPPPTEQVALPEQFGGLWLYLPSRAFGARPVGVVILAPDVVGRDGRATPYVEALLRHGIAAAELVTDAPASLGELQAALVVARQVLADDPRFTAQRIAMLGFGEGARAALAWAGWLPVAALYPPCAAADALPLPESPKGRAPLLLLHPARDATEPTGACARLAEAYGPGAFRHAYADTTPGWDIPPTGAIAGPVMQPRDIPSYLGAAGGQRYQAEYRPGVTEDAARRVAWFVSAALGHAGPWVPPEYRP